MALVGMDTDLAQTQHSSLTTQGIDAIQNILTSLDGLLGQIADNWKGNDSVNFHQEYQTTHRTQLNTLHQELTAFAQKFNQNIQDQINVSAS